VARLGDLVMVLQHRLPVPLVRVGYRVAYRLAQVWWYVLRPDMHGVKGILLDGDRVLLVRHTYGDRGRWDVPGGHARSGEPAAEAVRREMREELGVDIAWEPVGSLGATTDHKLERVHCFVAHRPAEDLVIARGEIADAEWFGLQELPARVGELSRRSLRLLSSGTDPAASAR
jgi:8-oxo-dGTP pyrophosphatase MutT (NUDIX family)